MNTPYIAQPGSGSENVSRFPDWRELLAILMERAWIGLAIAVSVFLYFYIDLKRETPYYRSTAVLLVEAQAPRLLNYQDIMALNTRNLEYFNTVINTLHSRQMMEYALETSGLSKREDFFPEAKSLEAKAVASRRLVRIVPVEKSRLINVTAEHPSPKTAAELANAVARSYIQQDLDNRMNASMQAVEWLREKSMEYREKLEEGLLELQKYRENTESVSLEEDQNIVIAKLKALNTALTAAQTERIDAETQWKAIQSQMEKEIPFTMLAPQLNDLGVNEALSKLTVQQESIARLQQRYKPGYPDLQQAIDFEQNLRRHFEAACSNAVYALKTRYETLLAREANLLEALREQEQQSFALDRKLVRYNDLKRNVEADQEIYQSMISRMKEASVSGSLPTEIIRLAEEARPSGAPYRPQPRQVLVRGLVVGLALGVGAIFLLYYTDHRFRRSEEVERALQMPVLATLPLISGRSEHERGMISQLKQTGEVAESFRTLRASMMMNPDIKDSRVFMITSSQPGEGKSLVSTNLAISFAQDGRKTLLLGADLRRPALTKIFNTPDSQRDIGLSGILKGEYPWRDAVMANLVDNLDVISSGKPPSHPSELLGVRRLADFMGEIRKEYDCVIIDAPPVLGVSDSLVLLAHADGVLFVVRYGVTHSLGATHGVKKILESGTPCFGAIMNGVNLKSLANYYYYRRYGGYAYHKYITHAPESKGA